MVVIMGRPRKLIYGVGINDVDYSVTKRVNGKEVRCPIYRKWLDMIARCYSERELKKNPSYLPCHVCAEWLSFSNFRAWMVTQNWQGMELDKDMLYCGNKIYSPKTCVFVDRKTNVFTIDRLLDRGDFPVGVHYDSRKSKFISQCSNPFSLKREYLGQFDCPEEAHSAWRSRKHELACQLADLQTDERVANALRTRYTSPL